MLREVEPATHSTPLAVRWPFQVHIVWYLILLGHAREASGLARAELDRISRPGALPAPHQMLAENLGHALLALGRWDEVAAVVANARQEVLLLAPRSPRVALWDILMGIHTQDVRLARGLPVDGDHFAAVQRSLGAQPWNAVEPQGGAMAFLARGAAADGDLERTRALLDPLGGCPIPSTTARTCPSR